MEVKADGMQLSVACKYKEANAAVACSSRWGVEEA